MTKSSSYYRGIAFYDVVSKLIPGGVLLVTVLLVIPSETAFMNHVMGANVLGVIVGLPVAYTAGVMLQGLSGAAMPRSQLFQRRMERVRIDSNFQNTEELGDVVGRSDTVIATGGEHVDRGVWIDIIQRFELPTKFLYKSTARKTENWGNHSLVYKLLLWPILRIFEWGSLISLSDFKYGGIQYGAEQRGFRLAHALVLQEQLGRIERFSSLYVLHRSLVMLATLGFVLFEFSAISAWRFEYTTIANSPLLLLLLGFVSVLSVPVFFNGMIRYGKTHDKELLYTYYANVMTDRFNDGAVGIEPQQPVDPAGNQPP